MGGQGRLGSKVLNPGCVIKSSSEHTHTHTHGSRHRATFKPSLSSWLSSGVVTSAQTHHQCVAGILHVGSDTEGSTVWL